MSASSLSVSGASAVRDLVPPGSPIEVTPDVAYLRTAIANVAFVGQPGLGDRGWTLVDAGIPGCAALIRAAAAARYGPESRPAAIVLTHGHFDHVGALEELATAWDVPIYAHYLERPYLDGRSPYPPPDPSVGGGMMARLAWLYPRGPIDVSGRLLPLSEDGSIPPLPGWRWIHTPGHTAGHVSLFRDRDRTLIVGDAFITVKQESALAVMAQRPEMHGPPAYYTTDWAAAGDSVRTLALLEPEVALTGHGVPLRGEELRQSLHALARDFERIAVPADGRYVREPAITDENGVAYVPPDPSSPWPRLLAGAGAGVVAGLAVAALWRGTLGRRRPEPDIDLDLDHDVDLD